MNPSPSSPAAAPVPALAAATELIDSGCYHDHPNRPEYIEAYRQIIAKHFPEAAPHPAPSGPLPAMPGPSVGAGKATLTHWPPPPWIWSENAEAVWIQAAGEAPHPGRTIASMDGMLSIQQDRENASRIVLCVNALAGIADPAAAVQQARLFFARLHRQNYAMDAPTADEAEAVRAALGFDK